MTERVLVTGGTGQVGSAVCRSLLTDGNTVVIYDVNPNIQNIQQFKDEVKVIRGDVLDLNKLHQTIRREEISTIIHLAASLVLGSREDPTIAIKVNCIGTNNMFEVGRLFNLKRIIFASSSAVYGKASGYASNTVNEDDTPRCPVDPYSATKIVNEVMGQFYYNEYGVPTLCYRISATWGPGRYTGFTGRFNDVIRKAARGEKAEIPKDFCYRKAKLRWFYVEELGDCLAFGVSLQEAKLKRRLYNIGTRDPYTVKKLVNTLQKIVPNTKIRFQEDDHPTPIAAGIAGLSGLDMNCERLYSELGYKEKLSLETALITAVKFEKRQTNAN